MEDREMEINLREILYRICVHWRMLIVLMLVFAVAFGALGYRRSVNSALDDYYFKVGEMDWFINDQYKKIDQLESVIETLELELAGAKAADDPLKEKLAEEKVKLAEEKADLEFRLKEKEDYLEEHDLETVRIVSPIQPKWIVIGLIAGLFCGGLWFFVTTVLKTTLLASEEVVDFSLQLLGTFPKKRSKERKGLDGFIDRLFGKSRCASDSDEICRLIASRIVLSSRAENVDSVFISNSVGSSLSFEFIGKIAAELHKADVSAEYGESVLWNSSSVERLCNCKSLVTVYEVDKTSYEEIRKEKALCLRNGIEIIGSIVVE